MSVARGVGVGLVSAARFALSAYAPAPVPSAALLDARAPSAVRLYSSFPISALISAVFLVWLTARRLKLVEEKSDCHTVLSEHHPTAALTCKH